MSWPMVKLGSLVIDERSGASLTRDEFTDTGVAVVPKKAISESVDLLEEVLVYTSRERFMASKSAHVSNKYLITTLRNLNPDGSTLGLICRNNVSGEFMLAQGVHAFLFDECVDLNYICYASRQPKFRAAVQRVKVGSTQVHMRARELKDIEISLPPLPEQKRIAAILDKADAIRRKRQEAILLADDFIRAVFLDMFGDPGANPKGFNEAVLGELTTGKTNNGLFRKNDEYGGSVPVAWVGELFRGNKISFSEGANRIDPTVKEIDAYGLKYGDLLFCRSSLKLEGIGFNNVYLDDDDNALFECHLIRMSPCLEKVNPVFLNYQLRMPSIRARIFQQAKTSTMTTIDQAGLSRIKVFVPPLDLQEEFERRLVKVESFYSHLYKNKSLDELAFSSISQKAFSGQL